MYSLSANILNDGSRKNVRSPNETDGLGCNDRLAVSQLDLLVRELDLLVGQLAAGSSEVHGWLTLVLTRRRHRRRGYKQRLLTVDINRLHLRNHAVTQLLLLSLLLHLLGLLLLVLLLGLLLGLLLNLCRLSSNQLSAL